MHSNRLDLDPETMRLLGYRTVDWLVERAAERRDEPILRQESPVEMRGRLPLGEPREGESFDLPLEELATEIVRSHSSNHPRHFGFVTAEGKWTTTRPALMDELGRHSRLAGVEESCSAWVSTVARRRYVNIGEEWRLHGTQTEISTWGMKSTSSAVSGISLSFERDSPGALSVLDWEQALVIAAWPPSWPAPTTTRC